MMDISKRPINTLFMLMSLDGKAISTVEELNKLKVLELVETNVLQDSYVQLKYKVLN